MSETMISKGYFGKLKDPVTGAKQDVEAWETRDLSLPGGWGLTYDGTMIFSNDEQRPASDVEGLIFANPEAKVFREQAEALGYEVTQVKFYVSHWYSGSASPMITAKAEDVFL